MNTEESRFDLSIFQSKQVKIVKTLYDYHSLVKHLTERGQAVYGPDFQIHDIDLPLVNRLLAYFLQDEAVAEAEGINLNKGILLVGPIGCGKTSLMKLMCGLCSEAYRPIIKKCQDISHEFGQDGFDTILKYGRNSFFLYTSIPRVFCFDDLGIEGPVKHWGNNINVIGEILLSRYDLMISHKMITHATTNLNADELEAVYGNRLRSRMRSMFNILSFDPNTPDKRK